ncbi:MAG: hypothetical protein KKA19_08480, partial [Candidatus Margulisbacteria bacterium]|nr:hypothetical protein [Candidatus Margulisiibacteriota bacterium]
LKKANAHIVNNTIAYNQLGLEIDLFFSGKVDFYNNIVAFNTSYGLNASVANTANLLIDYNNFYNNGLNYQGIEAGKNDISVDPGFKNRYLKTFQGFRLRMYSPCEDKGSTNPFQKDLDYTRNDQGFTGGPDAQWH